MNLFDAILAKGKNPTVVGLDPRPDGIPAEIRDRMIQTYGHGTRAVAESFYEFGCGILDAVCDIVPAVKPQIAFYEPYGAAGIRALARTVRYAKSLGLYVIMDAKRGDIGSTAEAYAATYLGETDAFGVRRRAFLSDAVTVNAYLGADGVNPFLRLCQDGRMIFALLKTSNPSSGELQDQKIGNTPVYEHLAALTESWAKDLPLSHGYHALGAVVGATYPQELNRLRALLPHTFFLVPGYGAQGGKAADIASAFDENGLGAIVNSSRGILYAYRKDGSDYKLAAARAASAMRDDLLRVIEK